MSGRRQSWSNQIEFVLSCISYAVGIGNVWRFPYLVYRSGGGAFFIPFLLILLVMGLPLFFLELIVGQYTGLGATVVYARMAPIFQGLGYCTIVVITFVTIYYMVIIAWMMFYFFASFSKNLAWSLCDNDFNTPNCFSYQKHGDCQLEGKIFFNKTCKSMEQVCRLLKNYTSQANNFTYCFDNLGVEHNLKTLYNRTLSTEEYFNNYVLRNNHASWDNFGNIRWELLGCLTLCWIIGYFCLIKGVQSMGKVVYFTTLFPYVVLIALFIRGITLEGSYDGIIWYLKPDWDKLQKPTVWGDAASQVFYSLGIGCGSLISLASYSSFTNNSHKDAIFVSVTNVLTSLFAGFITFSIMGFLMHKMNLPIHEVVKSETGLTFVVFPEAVVLMPWSNMWAIFFFFMLMILGLGSQFAGVQAISDAILDFKPNWRKYESQVIAGICFFCWLAAIPMVFDGGIYLYVLMDWNTASWAILLIGVAELIVPAWLYGSNKLFENLDHMRMHFGPVLRAYWGISWKYLAPVTSLLVFTYLIYNYEPAKFGDYKFPKWADGIGISIGLTTLLPMPIFFIYHLWNGPRDKTLFKPTKDWGPSEKSINVEKITSR